MQVSSFAQHSNLQLAGNLAVAFIDIAQWRHDGQSYASVQAVGYTMTVSQHQIKPSAIQ